MYSLMMKQNQSQLFAILLFPSWLWLALTLLIRHETGRSVVDYKRECKWATQDWLIDQRDQSTRNNTFRWSMSSSWLRNFHVTTLPVTLLSKIDTESHIVVTTLTRIEHSTMNHRRSTPSTSYNYQFKTPRSTCKFFEDPYQSVGLCVDLF